MFQLDKITHLKRALENKGSHIKQTERNAYFYWYTEAARFIRLQNSKIASLKNLLQKANKHLKIQDSKQKRLQLQALRGQELNIPGPPTSHPPRGPPLKPWPSDRFLSCNQSAGALEERLSSKGLCRFVHITSNGLSYLPLEEDPHRDPSQSWLDSNGFSSK